MREEFEKLLSLEESISNGTTVYQKCSNKYRCSKLDASFVNGAWYAYQEQQKKLQAVYDDCTEYTTVSDLLDSIKDILK